LKVDNFLVERWMNKYELDVEINIAETCVQPFTLRGFLEFVDRPDFLDEIMDVPLTYGHIEGAPSLREGITKLYQDVEPNNILVTGGAIEANFNAFYSLVEPSDRVISIFPAYQQLYSVAKGFGAEVKRLNLKPENNWLPDIEELKTQINSRTSLIVINNPHNPTGSLIDEGMLRGICEVAEERGTYVLCDEAYRGLYIDEKDKTPSVVDIYDNGVSTGSFSKQLSLTGLRLGWITSNTKVIKECMLHRDYTTISKGVIDEALGAIAMKHVDKILKRNNKIIRYNHKRVNEWINNEPMTSWIPPKAGSVGFMQHHLDMTAEKLCKDLIFKKNILMVPGDCFEMSQYIRIGYGNSWEILVEGLNRFKEYLAEL
jgi:aspartate/methionine/tyrosine aminotransferase